MKNVTVHTVTGRVPRTWFSDFVGQCIQKLNLGEGMKELVSRLELIAEVLAPCGGLYTHLLS